MIPAAIERTHIEQAMARVQAEGVPPQNTSRFWAVEHEGNRYPPKLLVSIAAELATGKKLPLNEFSSGGPQGAQRLLEKLGFSQVKLEVPNTEGPDDEEDEEDEEPPLDVAGAEQVLRALYPDDTIRKGCVELLADCLAACADLPQASWLCSAPKSGTITLTAGRAYAFSLQRARVQVVGSTDVLTPEQREKLDAFAKSHATNFASVKDCLSYEFAPERSSEAAPLLAAAYKDMVKRAAAAVKQTPYARHHRNAIIETVEHLTGRKLPRPQHELTGSAVGVDWTQVQQAFASFRADAGERFRVALRRRRATELRALLATPDTIDAERFDQEVWPLEAKTLLRGQDITGQLFRGNEPIPEEMAAAWSKALDDGAFEFHGNYVWGSGSRVFGAMFNKAEDRTEYVRQALVVLNNPALTPLQKAKQIQDAKGFGPNIATGLVMMYHPQKFALWNKVSKSLFAQLGYETGELEQFEASAAALRARLGADDALEADWFFYLLSNGRYADVFPAIATTEVASNARRIVKIAPGEGGAYWKDCLDSGYVVVGWDEVGDLRSFSDFDAFKKAFSECFSGHYKNHRASISRAANELWSLRALRPGDLIVANRGKSEILAVGEVVAPAYEFLAERPTFKQIVRVKWDTSKACKVPSQERWMRTIVPLSEAEFAGLLRAQPTAPGTIPPPPPQPDDYAPPALAQVIAGVEAEGLRLDPRTVRRYHVALQVRGFVILAGVSGTGKTWLTQAYANALKARYLLVPVAPNWTSNEDLLGYYNPLSSTYFDTAVSRFLREAATEYRQATEAGKTARPFHLVLDEMNLARVEHYFAKFLSALEVRQRDKLAELELHAGELVPLTPNLSFIGTVNVDETTHGFSDKVYDRAQLLELPAPRELLAAHVANEACGEMVMKLWDAVSPVAPFAFRVLDDVVEYVERSVELSVDWKEALDEQIVQKVLTKLKGTDPRIATALEGVVALTDGQFPLSNERARRMLEGFRQHGFASFF